MSPLHVLQMHLKGIKQAVDADRRAKSCQSAGPAISCGMWLVPAWNLCTRDCGIIVDMDVLRLRADTRLDHLATEEAMPLMRAAITRTEYECILMRLWSVVTSWETWAEAHAPEDLAGMVRARRRGSLIERDLQSLGIDRDANSTHFEAARIPGLESKTKTFRAAFLGAMYVVEGSTLGGQQIARHVEAALGMNATRGASYFRGYGELTAEMWRHFKAVLTEVPDAESEVVIAAARAMFEVFRMTLLGQQ